MYRNIAERPGKWESAPYAAVTISGWCGRLSTTIDAVQDQPGPAPFLAPNHKIAVRAYNGENALQQSITCGVVDEIALTCQATQVGEGRVFGFVITATGTMIA
ncbi:Uncharacterised protein [Mycobacteroides abscessus subsp. abscessus]|nr:Uncharacterised protein [Mycobacteroides abscessus subsp. abscessus]